LFYYDQVKLYHNKKRESKDHKRSPTSAIGIMGCGCRKKGNNQSMQISMSREINPLDPPEWGPILWKYMHCLAEKLGTSGNAIVDTDQANYMEILITMLPLILPCTECQGHAASYLNANPLPSLKGLYNSALRTTVRSWLFAFHNAVRTQKSQEIIVQSEEECSKLYENCLVLKCEYTSFIQSVAAAVRQGWVRMENWRKWYSHAERMRILSGNFVV